MESHGSVRFDTRHLHTNPLKIAARSGSAPMPLLPNAPPSAKQGRCVWPWA
jgi:hypothetical protein